MLFLILSTCFFFWHLMKNDKEMQITGFTKKEKVYLFFHAGFTYAITVILCCRGKIWLAAYIGMMLSYVIMMAIMDYRKQLVYPMFFIIYLILAEVVCVLEFSKFSISILFIPIIFFIIHKMHLFQSGDIAIASVGTFAIFLITDFWYDRILLTLFMLLISGVYFICENLFRKNIRNVCQLKSPAPFSPALLVGMEFVLLICL